MKKLICLLLILMLALSLVACYSEGDQILDNFVVINNDNSYGYGLVYDRETHIVYHLQYGGNGGFLSLYYIYQDGLIYGAVYKNGDIVPIPFAH